jgi:hypothetical protein
MQLLLHIGTHKTGSTAIQRFCLHNRDALAAQGVLYPNAYIANAAQHALAWALGVNHPKRDQSLTAEQVAQGFLDEARKAGAKRLIVSSEDLESLGDEGVMKLRNLFKDIPAQIVVYLRRQDEAFLAAYNQRVKSFASRFHGTVEELSRKRFVPERFDYWRLTQRWAKVFGDDAMRVRVYDPSRFPDRNIIPDFFSVLNLSLEGMTESSRSVNKSVHPLALEIIRRSNTKDMTRVVHNAMVRKLREASSKHPTERPRLPAAAHQEFIERFRESNVLVARKWLGRENGVLFSDSSGTSLEEPKQNGDLSEALLVEVLIDSLLATLGESKTPKPKLVGALPRLLGGRGKRKKAPDQEIARGRRAARRK